MTGHWWGGEEADVESDADKACLDLGWPRNTGLSRPRPWCSSVGKNVIILSLIELRYQASANINTAFDQQLFR